MTYPSEDEKTTELPRWMHMMRVLVMALLCVSILAMASLIYAAFRIVGASLDAPLNFEELAMDLPEGATPLSLTILPNDQKIIIYQQNSDYFGRIIDPTDINVDDLSIQ